MERSVLIVDDEEALLSVLSTKLREEGLTVYTAANGREALEVAFNKHPYLILLDIMMPEMDGFEVMEHLRNDDWGKTVPIMLLTNSSSIETISRAVSSGMSEFIVKTELKLDEIVDRVKARLGA